MGQDDKNQWGCSCPIWKFKRQVCHHIMTVQADPDRKQDEPVKLLEVVPGHVEEVTEGNLEDGTPVLLAPLIPIGNISILATIVYDLLKRGYPLRWIRQRYWMIPREWTVRKVMAYIERYGRTKAVLRCGW